MSVEDLHFKIQKNLVVAARKGDVVAHKELLRQLNGLSYILAQKVISIAYLKWASDTYEDLRSEGFVGYALALKKYKPGKGSFSGYAYLWMRAFHQGYARQTDRIVPQPAHIRDWYVRRSRPQDEYLGSSPHGWAEYFDPREEEAENMKRIALKQALGYLDVITKNVMQLKLQGYHDKEIGSAFRRSDEWARLVRLRGEQMLKEIIATGQTDLKPYAYTKPGCRLEVADRVAATNKALSLINETQEQHAAPPTAPRPTSRFPKVRSNKSRTDANRKPPPRQQSQTDGRYFIYHDEW